MRKSKRRDLLTLWLLSVGSMLVAGFGEEAPAKVAPGTLWVRSQPGVEVLWEGTLLGGTDRTGSLEIGSIPPGTYSLELRKREFESRSLQVTIESGSQELELFLQGIAAPGPVSSKEVESEPVAAPRDPQQTAAAASAERPAPLVGPEVGAGASATRDSTNRLSPADTEAPSVSSDEQRQERAARQPAQFSTTEETLAADSRPEATAAADSANSRWTLLSTLGLALAGLLLLSAGIALRRRARSKVRSRRPPGPRVVLEKPRRRRRTPLFFDDLKARETALEDLVEARTGRAKRKVIEVEVIDSRATEDGD